jgi:hypothetical protein
VQVLRVEKQPVTQGPPTRQGFLQAPHTVSAAWAVWQGAKN